VASTVTRLVLVFRAAPWSVGFAWDRDVARSVLRIGVPLQVSRVVAQAQYWVTPTVVAATIGPAPAGLLQWAAGNGRKPLDVLEHLARVSLPHFARLQHDEAEVELTVTRYAGAFMLASGFWLCVLAVAGRDLVGFVYTDRWVPAVPAMVLFAGVGVFASVRLILTTALAGLGRTALVGRVAVGSAVATIVASIALVPPFGVLGVPLGQLVGALVALPFLIAGLGTDAIPRVLRSAVSTLVPMTLSVAVGLVIRSTALAPAERGITTAVVMTVAYVAAVWFVGPRWMRTLVREQTAGVFSRRAA